MRNIVARFLLRLTRRREVQNGNLFYSSLKPVLFPFRMVGINLFADTKETVWSMSLYYYGLFLLALNVGFCAYRAGTAIQRITAAYYEENNATFTALGDLPDNNRTAGSEKIIEIVANTLLLWIFYICSVTTHSFLLFGATINIKHLWKLTANLDLNLNPKQWQKLRFLAVGSAFAICFQNLFYPGLALYCFGDTSRPGLSSVKAAIHFCDRFASAASICYAVLACGLYSILKHMKNTIKVNDPEEGFSLSRCCKVHRTLCTAINSLVASFRFVFLSLGILSLFMSILVMFLITQDIYDEGFTTDPCFDFFYGVKAVETVVLFWLICFVSDCLQKELNAVLRNIAKARASRLHLVCCNTASGSTATDNQNLNSELAEVDAYVNSNYLDLPSFSVFGFFELKRNLTLVLLATILSYGYMLWEFRQVSDSRCPQPYPRT